MILILVKYMRSNNILRYWQNGSVILFKPKLLINKLKYFFNGSPYVRFTRSDYLITTKDNGSWTKQNKDTGSWTREDKDTGSWTKQDKDI